MKTTDCTFCSPVLCYEMIFQPSASQSINKMPERHTLNIPLRAIEFDSPWLPPALIRGSSSHIKAHTLGLFCWGRCESSTRGVKGGGWSCVVASLCCNPQWSHLVYPMGLPLQESCLCSKMYLFSYSFWELCKTKKDAWRIEPFSLPPCTPSKPCPTTSSLPSSLTLPHSPSHTYFAGDANDLPPLYSDARSVYTFPFHPHTNVLLLPLRPRAF